MVPNQEGQKLKCEICGNEVMVLYAGGGNLTCCGQSMPLLKEGGELENKS